MKVKDHFLTGETFEIVDHTVQGVRKTTPLPQNLEKYYDSSKYVSHNQDEGGLKNRLYKFAQNFNLKYKKNILLRLLPTGSLVLDYGCGAGEFLKHIADVYNVIGFEPNSKAKEFTSNKIGKEKVLNDINDLNSNSVDCITLWHVLEHIENEKDMISVFYNKLKDNGLLIIAVPNYKSFDADYYQEYWAAYDVPRHVSHYSQSGIKNVFDPKKWTVEKIKPLPLDSYYISITSEKYRKNSFAWLKGSIIGAISNLKASKNGEFSSLIYIVRKN